LKNKPTAIIQRA